MGKLKVGAGRAVIALPDEMYPIPRERGDHYDCSRDDMSCRAVAIDNGEERYLLIVYELTCVPNVEGLEKKIQDAVGVKKENIILAATHNHTAPKDYAWRKGVGDSPEELEFYRKFLDIELKSGIEAASKAVNTLRPALYGYGECDSYININRDRHNPFGYWLEAREPEGYSDKTLAVIKFTDLEGRLIATILNHGTHATMGFIHRDFDHKLKTSGNFTAVTCDFIEKHYGDGAIAVWTSGAAGNQNPVFSRGLQFEYPDGYSTRVKYPEGTEFLMMEEIGRNHAVDAVRCIDSIQRMSENMPVTHIKKNVYLPRQKPANTDAPRMPFKMGGKEIRDEQKIPYGQVPPVPEGPKMVVDPENPVELRMQLLLLGDIALICADAELYAEIGRDMKKASPYRKTIVVTHSDTKDEVKEQAGYILDKSSAGHKVFQAFGANVVPGSSDELIINNSLDMFDEALNDRKNGSEK